jgi:hypothetical protein
MPIKSKAYPFPVLQPDFSTYSSEDVFDASFRLEIDFEEGQLSQVLFPRVTLKNSAIEELLVNGQVGIYVEVYAPASYQRAILEISLGGKEIDMASFDLTGSVELTAVILAKEDIHDFKPSGVINEFSQKKSGFKILRSDLLAYSYTEVFEVGMDHQVRPDFLRVQPVPDQPDHWVDFNVDAPVLSILLSPKMMSFWVAHKQDKSKKASLFTNIYRQCLARAIEEIQERPETEYAWAKTLQNECARRGIDWLERDSLDVASELLFDKGFGSILKLEEKSDD